MELERCVFSTKRSFHRDREGWLENRYSNTGVNGVLVTIPLVNDFVTGHVQARNNNYVQNAKHATLESENIASTIKEMLCFSVIYGLLAIL